MPTTDFTKAFPVWREPLLCMCANPPCPRNYLHDIYRARETQKTRDFEYPAYPAKIESMEGGGYSVRFPDLPEANTGGNTFGDAITRAQDWLAKALESKFQEGAEIPEPTAIENLPGRFWTLVIPKNSACDPDKYVQNITNTIRTGRNWSDIYFSRVFRHER